METLEKECRRAERAVENAQKKRMEEFEAYVLGKKEGYNASTEQVEMCREKYEALREELSRTEDKVREYNRMKVHESFPVMRLTPELLDEYVDSIEVHPGNDVRVIWK